MLAAMAGSFSSCSPVEPYQPEPVPEGLQLYFPTTVLASTYDINELTGDKIDITVCRVKCDEAATVNISSTVDAPAGAITVPASVDFGYLATEAHLLISLDKTLIPLDSEAKVELSIPDAANVGTFGDTKFIVTIKNPTPQLWIKFDDGIIYETPYWGEEEAKTMYYMEYAENIRLCKVEKCFGAGCGELGVAENDERADIEVFVQRTQGKITLETLDIDIVVHHGIYTSLFYVFQNFL